MKWCCVPLICEYVASERDRLFNNFRHLLRASRLVREANLRLASHFVYDLWLLFCLEAEELAQHGNAVRDPLMMEAKALIERHAFRDVQMRDIVEYIGIHPVQFSRRFHAAYAMPPSQYLYALRMEKAKSLLVQTTYPIDRIAGLRDPLQTLPKPQVSGFEGIFAVSLRRK